MAKISSWQIDNTTNHGKKQESHGMEWSPAEDMRLCIAMASRAFNRDPVDWIVCASSVGDRCAGECASRWHNHLSTIAVPPGFDDAAPSPVIKFAGRRSGVGSSHLITKTVRRTNKPTQEPRRVLKITTGSRSTGLSFSFEMQSHSL
jgi:hypothetical protein